MEYEPEMQRSRDERDEPSIARFQEAQLQHAKTFIQEESFWQQRAKMHWLKDGNLDTIFLD
jgi:hypothetical protein